MAKQLVINDNELSCPVLGFSEGIGTGAVEDENALVQFHFRIVVDYEALKGAQKTNQDIMLMFKPFMMNNSISKMSIVEDTLGEIYSTELYPKLDNIEFTFSDFDKRIECTITCGIGG